MRLLLNIIWFVLAGLWLAIGYAVAALICFVLIITIPFGIAALRIGIFALWPFGRTVVRRPDAGAGSAIGNVIWVVLCGWWLALAHLVSGVLLCLTILGIPLGLANFKLIPVSLLPFGRDIVTAAQAEQLGLQPQVTVGRAGRPDLPSTLTTETPATQAHSRGARLVAHTLSPRQPQLTASTERGPTHGNGS